MHTLISTIGVGPAFFKYHVNSHLHFKYLLEFVAIWLVPLLIGTPAFSQQDNSTLRIGFLVKDKADIDVFEVADLALEELNKSNNPNSRVFELVTKTCEGPWGMTSKQAVSLIFEEEVPIIVTALDGENAHLVEQVIAKSHVLTLSTVSSDVNLSGAYVPWYFSLVPDDKKQSRILQRMIGVSSTLDKTAMLVLDNYDGRKSAEAFKDEAASKHVNPSIFDLTNLSPQLPDLKDFNAIVLAGFSDQFSEGLPLSSNHKIYGFINTRSNSFNSREVLTIIRGEGSTSNNTLSFEEAFRNKYGKDPLPHQYFIFDGLLIAAQAITEFGSDPEKIRTGFGKMSMEGVTGPITFDRLSNREWP